MLLDEPSVVDQFRSVVDQLRDKLTVLLVRSATDVCGWAGGWGGAVLYDPVCAV
jgi:hypothetical protein